MLAGKAEAHHDVRDRIARPIDREQIDRVQLAQIEGAIVIARHEVLLGAIVEVADIVQRDEIAILRRIGQDRDLGLPVALIGRLDREPPQQHDRERGTEAEQRPAPVRQEQERAKGAQRERRGESEPEWLTAQIRVVDRERGPCGHAGNQESKAGDACRAQHSSGRHATPRCLITKP